mgnify:CR=1 FL=1
MEKHNIPQPAFWECSTSEEIWSVVEVIKREGVATIIVDKNISKLMEIADHHLIVVKGEVVFSGDGAKLSAEAGLMQQYLGV